MLYDHAVYPAVVSIYCTSLAFRAKESNVDLQFLLAVFRQLTMGYLEIAFTGGDNTDRLRGFDHLKRLIE